MVGRTGVVAALLVGMVVFAGCAQSEALDAPVVSESKAPRDSLVTGAQGGIRGVVIDESLSPVGNATVIVDNGTKDKKSIVEIVTGDNGVFEFGPLPPQTYRVRTEPVGYAPTSQLVQVLAGEVTEVKLTVGAVASKEAYLELLIENGVAGCSFTVIWLVLGGPCSIAFPDNYKNQFKFHILDSWQYAVFEAAWQTNDAMWMFTDLEDDGTCVSPGSPCPGTIIGTSPIRIDGSPGNNGTEEYQHGEGVTYPKAGNEFDLWLNFSDFGLFYDELNNYGEPVCDLNGGCGGVGTSVEIRFATYVSIFHHALPPSVADYTAVPDE